VQPVAKKRLVTCPTCGAQSEYSPENAYRPFCSKRCKLTDLGQWATESYRIPITETSQEPPDEN